MLLNCVSFIFFLNATCAACSLDELLEGGIYSGEVTELCGAPGVGKTQVSNVHVIVCNVDHWPYDIQSIGGISQYT